MDVVDWLVVGGILLWSVSWLTLAGFALTTRKQLRAIMVRAVPLMDKAYVVLDQVQPLNDLGEKLEAIPATIVLGVEKVLQDQLETKGSPLRAYTSALVTEGVTAFDEVLAKRMEPLAKILPAASTILSRTGTAAVQDKAEGRKQVAEILDQFGPVKGLVTKFMPKSSMDDPMDFLAQLARMKGTISAFSPGIGAQIDSALQGILMGGANPLLGGENPMAAVFGATGAPTEARPNPSSTASSYGV